MKLGLVLEGGAAYCAFQAGAIDELHRRKIRFSHVTGVSAGALNGCAIVSGRTHELLDLWRSLKGLNIINLRHMRWNWSPFDLSRITKEIIEKFFPMDRLMDSKIELAVVTTRLPRFRRQVYTNRDKIDLVAALRASNLIPILHSRPVILNGAFHIDGGFVDNAPVDIPLGKGCDRVVAIVNNSRGALYRKLFPPRNAIKEHRKKLILIHPLKPLPLLFPFDFHGNRMERVFEIGQQAARHALQSGVFQ